MLTRKDFETYTTLKSKILFHDKSTQTDDTNEYNLRGNENVIIFSMPFRQGGRHKYEGAYDDDYEEDSDYEDDEDNEDNEDNDTSDNDDDSEETDDVRRGRKRCHTRNEDKSLAQYFPDEKKYYNRLTKKQKQQINTFEKEIIKANCVTVPMRFKILESDMDVKLKALAIRKLEQLNHTDPSESEYFKLQTWIENLCKLPIGKYKPLSLNSASSPDSIKQFLDTTKNILDSKVYGHNDTKDQIVRLLAKWISNPASKGMIIGIEGPPGVGKTSLCNAVCESLGIPFGFVQLGGISDGSYLHGHSYTYVGSRWGKIADILMNSKCMNPVLYFDELDKVSKTRQGEEIANILIHLTDSTQNDKFQDKYFNEVGLDLSKCLIVFSYNLASDINPILRDRMVTMKAGEFNLKEKVKISQDYMLPLIMKEYSFDKDDIKVPTAVLEYLISSIEPEKGVRNLKRALEEMISQINLHRLLNKNVLEHKSLVFPMELDKDFVNKFVQKRENNMSLNMMYL